MRLIVKLIRWNRLERTEYLNLARKNIEKQNGGFSSQNKYRLLIEFRQCVKLS